MPRRHPEAMKQWNAASEDWHTTPLTVDVRVGGAFSWRIAAKDGNMGFDFAGTSRRIVEHELIEYSFAAIHMAQVAFTDSPHGVKVHGTFDSARTHSIEQQQQRWRAILNHFARHVEAIR